MSAAAAMAGAVINVQLIYIGTSQYLADFRKPEPGTECLYYISNPMEVFGDLEIEKAFALFDKYNYATDYAITGTVAVKYTGEYVKDTSTINAENMDVDFDVTFEKIAHNTMNTPDLKVKFSTLNGTPGNIVLLDGSDVTTVTLNIANGVVNKLTGASLTSLTFPNTKVE